MTGARWERSAELFERALALPLDERDPFLVREAGSDAPLLERVRAMLRADARSSPILDATPDELASLVAAEIPSLEGKRVGPYTIRSVIGRGGMGIVCLAEREDVGKQVALKLVAGGLGAPERVGRFLLERRVLAQLAHPHIAGFLDAGLADDGTPWLAMEHVPGKPLDRFADDRSLGIAARLVVFEKIARAVGYAHRHLIVHRDLKPSNVLVGDDGEPRLVDFGIAKLLDEPGESTFTEAGGGRMTPQYASPEQIRGEPITTASDVYQLGALLFELLTGERPHPARADRSRALALDPVPRPSQSVDADRAARRGTTLESLRKALAGDLDTIVAKATALDPRERYPTAEALGDDVHRHLQGLPVAARAATAGYRIRKFVARHRTGTAVVVAGLVAMLGFAVTMQVKNRRIEAERERAEQVSTLLADVFAGADPTVAQGDKITVRSVLDRGAARVRGDSAIAPEVKARLLEVIADAYENVGKIDLAVALEGEAVALLRAVAAEDDPVRLRALRRLGRLTADAGGGVRAYPPLEEALAVSRGFRGRRRIELAQALQVTGYAHQRAGDRDTARIRLEEALAIHKSLPAPGHRDLEALLINLAFLAENRGDDQDAEQLFREALSRRRARLGAEHSQTAKTMLDLAGLLARSNRLDEAETLVREAIAVQRRVFAEPHSDVIAGFGALARVLGQRGKRDEAEAAQREALEITRQLFGDSSSGVALAIANLAGMVQQSGRLDEAAELHRDAVRRFEAFYGSHHVSTAVAMANLAWTERLRRRFTESEALYRRAVPVLDSAWAGSGRASSTLVDFGIVLGLVNKDAEALEVLRRGLARAEAGTPANPGDVLRAKGFVGMSLLKLGRYSAAESVLVEAHRALLESMGPKNQYTVMMAGNLVQLYERWGRPADAARYRVTP